MSTCSLALWHTVAHAQRHTHTHKHTDLAQLTVCVFHSTHCLSRGGFTRHSAQTYLHTQTQDVHVQVQVYPHKHKPIKDTHTHTQTKTHIHRLTHKHPLPTSDWVGEKPLPASGRSPNQPKIMCQLSCKSSPSFYGDRPPPPPPPSLCPPLLSPVQEAQQTAPAPERHMAQPRLLSRCWKGAAVGSVSLPPQKISLLYYI